MAGDEEKSSRGMFGYEGEGFIADGEDASDKPRTGTPDRGWNIGRSDDEPESDAARAKREAER